MFISLHASLRRCVCITTLALVAAATAPGLAAAAVGAGASVTLPASVTVGQTGVPGSLTLENRNTAPDQAATNSVCKVAESSPPCTPFERGIVLVAACSQLDEGGCTSAGADPSVLRLAPTAAGRASGACAGMTFDVAQIDPAFGTVRFTPQTGWPVTLPAAAPACTIDFTFDVLRSPAGDQDAAADGMQTVGAAQHTQRLGTSGSATSGAVARGTSAVMTVLRAGPPAITLTPSEYAPSTVKATVTGLINPAAGATITFRTYPYFAFNCSNSGTTRTTPVTLAANVATATVGAFSNDGRHPNYLQVTYDGDANNLPASTPCERARPSPSGPPAPPFARAFVERVSAVTTPKRSRLRPHTFTTTGRILPPSRNCTDTVATAAANCMPFRYCPPGPVTVLCNIFSRSAICSGIVNVRLRRNGHTISSGNVRLRPDCAYRGRVNLRSRGSRRPGAIRVRARFKGNQVLRPRSSATHAVRIG